MGKNYLPSNSGAFDIFQNILYNAVVINAARWKIPAEPIAALEVIRTLWIAIIAEFNDPAKRTKAVTRTKNNLQNEYSAKLRLFVKAYLINNENVTDADKIVMGLPIHDTTRTPAPAPTTRPSLTIDFSHIGRHTVNVRDEGANKTARPKGVLGYELRALIGTMTEPQIDDMPLIGISMKSAHVVEYSSAHRSKFVWYVARWVNSHEEKGPWSEMVGALIN